MAAQLPPVDVARARFAEAGLTFPPVPDGLAPSLRGYDNWIFSTRDDAPAPYGFDWYIEECLAGEVSSPYCVFGHDGYGLNSAAIHFYLVRGPLALFMQIPWGGIYTSTPVDAQQVRYHFEQAADLIATLDDAQSRGNSPLVNSSSCRSARTVRRVGGGKASATTGTPKNRRSSSCSTRSMPPTNWRKAEPLICRSL